MLRRIRTLSISARHSSNWEVNRRRCRREWGGRNWRSERSVWWARRTGRIRPGPSTPCGVDLRSRNVRVTGFASSVVIARDGEFNHHTQGNNLHGVWSSFERLIPKAKVEPFFFWRLAPRVKAESGLFGKLDERTAGVRISGSITTRLTYVTEMVLQRGDSAGDSISAWAGHWRIEQGLPGRWSPKVRVESDYASGDRNPSDRHVGTFDVLYPTPHDKYGLADQAGWRNIEHLGTAYEIRPGSKVCRAGKVSHVVAGERSGRLVQRAWGIAGARSFGEVGPACRGGSGFGRAVDSGEARAIRGRSRSFVSRRIFEECLAGERLHVLIPDCDVSILVSTAGSCSTQMPQAQVLGTAITPAYFLPLPLVLGYHLPDKAFPLDSP